MKKIAKNKKGMFYIYAASIILIAIIIVFLIKSEYSYVDRQKISETRVNSINDLIIDLEQDSERVIYVSSYRSLIALEDEISKSGSFLNNTEEMFRIAFYNGTVNGEQVEVLDNSSYSEYLQKINQLASRIGVNLNISVENISLYHDSPWSINVVVSVNATVNDSRGLAYWHFRKNYSTQVPLYNIRDPVYSIGTLGKVPNTIRKTNLTTTEFVNEITNSTVILQQHTNYSFYMENPLAPSFLMRLSGNFSASPFGIESLVYVPEFDVQLVSYDSTKSIVDYIFLTNITGYTQKACSIQNLPSWMKIDLNHSQDYEIDSLSYTTC